MKRIVVLVSFLALSLVASGVLQAQENPFVGAWKMNVAKSKFGGSLKPPQSATRTVVTQDGGLKVTQEETSADGTQSAYSYTTDLDGKDSPVSGRASFDTVAASRVDANTYTNIVKKASKTVRTTTTVVSKDGKVTTVTGKGVNAQGQPISFTAVYDKQ
jgi:hypothetical protein